MRAIALKWRTLAILVSSLALGGCFLVAAGAGAGAAVVFTNRGAKSTVDGSVDQVFERSVGSFQQLGIAETGRSTAESGATRKLEGKKGDLDVTVELARESSSTTSVEVYARKNMVEYDKNFAKDVLGRIIQK